MTMPVPIKLNVANALRWLGSLYRNPADAIKEHISNAIDEHVKAEAASAAAECCAVVFTLEKRSVTVEYPYGMDKREFRDALERVADSAKKTIDVTQIGRLGIGIFSFQQIGRKCTFFSKKARGGETVRVTLREGADKAEFDRALRREALDEPGIRIVISELKSDPTRPRGPLAPQKLRRVFAEKFDQHLRKGSLRIEIRSAGDTYKVEPLAVHLARLAKGLDTLHLPGQAGKSVALDLYFEASGKGTVAIRQMGVVVVEDLRQLSAYGLEESVYAEGFVAGSIDADFLEPLPARAGFEENRDWVSFLDLLDKQRPQIEAEVEEFREKERQRALSEIQRRAIELAREILDLDEFRDLELLGGLRRPSREREHGRVRPTGRPTGERSREPGRQREPGAFRINYVEKQFETGPSRHSRFLGGEVQANELNPDFQHENAGPDDAKLAYATLMIGKETIAYNDKSGLADDHLEKLLGFYFKVKAKIAPAVAVAGARRRGRPRKPV